MDESKKKPIMIGIIVVCLVLAVVIWQKTMSPKSSGIEGIKRGEMVWVKCRNPACEAGYQIKLKGYLEYLRERPGSMGHVAVSVPALVCEKCGEESVYRAVKCEKCGLVFEKYPVHGDFADRCPECGYSKIEENRRKAAEARRGK